MKTEISRGQALDLASRHLIRKYGHDWTWARTDRGAVSWVVTVGADRPLWRVTVPFDGAGVTVVTA